MFVSLVVDPLCGSLFRLLSKLAGPVKATCHVASLVSRVGPYGGVKVFKKVTLLTSIGFSVGLCIFDSLNMMPELQTICIFSGS